jgi:large subunit ribosomal protein L13
VGRLRAALPGLGPDPSPVVLSFRTFENEEPPTGVGGGPLYCQQPLKMFFPGPSKKDPKTMRSYNAKPAEAEASRKWWVVDAADQPLGRVASKIAMVLRGKHKATFTPHVDTGDFVIVINAEKVKATGRKHDQKLYYTHSGVPGHLKAINLATALEKKPELPIKHAVKGMLPKNVLGRQLITKLKVYSGTDHPHAAQKPELLKI